MTQVTANYICQYVSHLNDTKINVSNITSKKTEMRNWAELQKNNHILLNMHMNIISVWLEMANTIYWSI